MKETKTKTIWAQGGRAEMVALCQAYGRSFERITTALSKVSEAFKEAAQAIEDMPMCEPPIPDVPSGIRQLLHNAWKRALPPQSGSLVAGENEAAWVRLLGTAADVMQEHAAATPEDVTVETLRRNGIEPPPLQWFKRQE